MNIHRLNLPSMVFESSMQAAGLAGAEHVQNLEIEYFRELITKSNIDRIDIVVSDGVTIAAKRQFSLCDWLKQWDWSSRELANEALTQCLTHGWSRTKLTTLADAKECRWHDVVLTKVEDGTAVVSVARDITDDVLAHDVLRRVAFEDGLTGLMNRQALRENLAMEIDRLTDTDGKIAVFMVDLDNFKFINDTLGHDAGDAVLVEAARRLRGKSPKTATVARLGGDEFAIILSAANGRLDVFAIAERLLGSMQLPVKHKGRLLNTQASIGVALYPAHGTSPSKLLKNADIALYAAKAFGRGGFSTYVPTMGSSLRKRASAIDAVRDALRCHRMQAFYQPKISLGSNSIEGFEAIPQLSFRNGLPIPDAAMRNAMDDVDVARQIGDRMFDIVAKDVNAWLVNGVPVSHIAINASAADFRSGDFAVRFLERLDRTQLPAELFEIEVSETVLAGRNTDYVASALADLANAGVRVALDDFGTGVSSILQLKDIPFDSIKIDQSIVQSLATDSRDEPIIRAMIAFADGLGLHTAAAGIQSTDQLETLRTMGCQTGQGDLWGQPFSASNMAAEIAKPPAHTKH